jgi:dTDP-4-dehydrorhamnose 3,5-epimerase-like enzyme
MKSVPKHSDGRGFLIEFLREDENVLNFKGQVYASTMKPGDIRGNHFHNHKTEIFCVMKGKLEVLLSDMGSSKVERYILDSEDRDIKRIMVKPKTAHCFTNIGEDLAVLLAYGDQVHDHDTPDQFEYQIK